MCLIAFFILMSIYSEDVRHMSTKSAGADMVPLYSYKIGIYDSLRTKKSADMIEGFKASLNDLAARKAFEFEFEAVPYHNPSFNDKDFSLILTVGKAALAVAGFFSGDIPIVSCGIVNFQELGLSSTETPDPPYPFKDHGEKVTGISSLPNMEMALSVIIESVASSPSVALVYATEDSDSIYQNTLLEKYMDEAGIPWKEYEITLPETVTDPEADEDDENDQEAESSTSGGTYSTSLIRMESSKEGTDYNAEPIGETGLLSGINEPESARIPRISSLHVNAADGVGETFVSESSEDLATLAETISKTSNVIFISSGSLLKPNLSDLTIPASNLGVRTVGGDEIVGIDSLLSLFTDPYDQGYRAGVQAYDIVVEDISPADIPIEYISGGMTLKLCTPEIALPMGLMYSKSFFSIHNILDYYVPGQMTPRLSSR